MSKVTSSKTAGMPAKEVGAMSQGGGQVNVNTPTDGGGGGSGAIIALVVIVLIVVVLLILYFMGVFNFGNPTLNVNVNSELFRELAV